MANFDLAIIGWSKARGEEQRRQWGIGVYPHPYHRDGINALLVDHPDQIRGMSWDTPIVIINLHDGTIPPTFNYPPDRYRPFGETVINTSFEAARLVKDRRVNYFEFNGDVTTSLEEILKKRVRKDGKWVVEEEVDG